MAEFVPHGYQSFCVDQIIEKPAVGLFLDMGLGKTVITLTAIRKLRREMWAVRKCLVVAPLKVAESTWSDEAAKWEHLKDLRFAWIMGTAKQRREALEATADVYLINRENIPWLVKEVGIGWPFDMVVLDESSSFKNPQAKRFKALRAVRGKISRIVELTGTPSPQGLMDLWAQVGLLDGGQRLGRFITRYREAYFEPDRRNGMQVYSYRPRPGAAEEIHRKISDICVSMKAEDYLTLPELIFDDIPVKLDPAAQKAYRRLERDMLLEVDETTVTAGSAAVLRGKLLQLGNGAVYDEDRNVVEVHRCKIDALLETVEQLNGQHAMICYQYHHDLTRLLEALKPTGLRVAVYEGADQQRAWNAGEIDLLLVQPASCGYGINLQQGGYHIIWFGLTDSLELYQQTNKRLHRQGQSRPVIVHHLLVQGGMDRDVLSALHRKTGTQDALLEALKARIRAEKEAG